MERETEHVRMLDAGRLQLPFAPLVASGSFAAVANDKFAALAHGNQHGLTFVPTSSGFAMATQQQYVDGCKEFISRKLTAIDHGQNASHVEVPALAIQKQVELATMAHVLSLSPDEQHLAVAYEGNLALFEVATIYESASPSPYHTFHNVAVDEIAWSPDTNESDGELRFAVLTHAKTVLSCSTNGAQEALSTNTAAVSVAWSPTGESIAVGTEIGSIDIFTVATLVHERSIGRPDCCEVGYEAHHVKWAEEDVFLVGYRQYDAEREETLALACLFEAGECVELDELVAYCDFEGRKHQYYSVFLADWRMFFVGCSLSADIELLVADPDSGEWEVWKASEKYQARLPMNSNDEEMYPVGLSLNLNTQDDIEVDDAKYPPPAVVSCATTDGLLINFSFVDLTVRELLPFVQSAEPFLTKPSRSTESPSAPATTQSTPASKPPVAKRNYTVTTSDVDNVPASEDSDDSDLEEEKEEERQRAIEAFDEIDAASSGVIDKSRFGDLLAALGTTYGDESHGKYAARLADASGVIGKEDFVQWYVEWIFGEQDSEDEDEEDASDHVQPTASATANALAKFAMAEGSWRCESCMVHNQEADAPKCISCESPNPKFKGTLLSSFGSSAPATASAFSFGVSSTTSSFRFGVDQDSTVQSESSSNFSFGVPAASATSAAPSTSSAGFRFGFANDTANVSKPATSAAKQEGGKSSVTEKVVSTRTSAKEDEGYGKNADNAFATVSDDDDSDYEEERKEEEEKARLAFAKISSGDESIPRERFPALFKALGSTYSEEEHSETCDSLDQNGRIYVDDFMKWYLDWLFGEDEESDEEDDEDDGSASAAPNVKSPEEIAAAFAKFQPKEGSWKCDVCFTMNPTADAQKCSSCESPNPAAPKVKLGESSTPSLGSIGDGGFKFAPSIESAKPSNFQFGFTPSTTAASDSASGGAQADTKPAGFSFGFTPAAGANSAASVSSAFGGTSPSTPSSFSFGNQPSGAGATPAFGSGFSFGTKNSVTTSQSPASSLTYPAETSKRAPPPPAPGAYPPDTSKKVPPPAAPGAYPPDTSKRAAPPPAPGAYPPSTANKPAPPPAPGAYPPSTAKQPAPPPFTLPGSTSNAPSASSFSFGSMGTSLFGSTKSTDGSTAETKPDAPKSTSVFSFSTSTPDASAKTAPSPFGIVPKVTSAFSFSGATAPATAATGSTTTSAFSFGSSTPSTTNTSGAPKAGGVFGASATPSSSPFSFPSSVQKTEPTTSSLPKPAALAFAAPTRPALSVPAPTKTNAAPQRPSIAIQEQGGRPSEKTVGSISLPNTKPFQDGEQPKRATASSPLEAQLWKLIIDFDRAFRRVNHSTQNVCSSEKTFQVQFARQMTDLQTKVSSLWDEVNLLDDVRDQIEKDVLFVIGSDGDVHEQLEYGREILASFKNEKLKRLLEEQPLDQRSEETRKTVQDKLAAVEQACDDLDRHIASTKNYTSLGAFGTTTAGSGAMSTAHLFRALKQTYDSSKIQYNRVSQLAQQLEVLSMTDRNAHQGVRGLATAPRSVAKSKNDMVQIITQADTRSRNVRRSFLALCNNVVTPRDVSAPRRKPLPSATPTSPRDKAFSRLMPRTQVTVASPISSVKSSSTSISFKDTPVKAGSKLFALAEDKAAPKEAKTFISAPQKNDPKPPVRLAPQRPSIPTFGGESSPSTQATEPSKSNEPPAKRSHGSSRDTDKSTARKTLSFDSPDFGRASFSGESSFPTPKAKPSVTFNLPSETTRASGSGTSMSASPDYKERLVKFYEAHNPSRVAQAAKTIEDFKGKEEEMFRRLFMKYIPGSTDDDVRKFLQGGPVPSKPSTTATGSLFTAPSSSGDAGNRSSFSFKSPSGPTPAASPFGKVSTPTGTSSPASVFGKSAFSLGSAASSPKPAPLASGGFSAFGQSSSASSAFGAPTTAATSNHKQRLIEFYTKHNPSKLGDVDATLEKYKGNEEKLFQNLAIKYKVNDTGNATTTIGFGGSAGGGFAPKSPAASPFGNAGTFSSISLGGGAAQSTSTFGTTSGMGFGANKPATAAAPSQSPFVTAPQDANAFRSASFGAPAAVGGGNGFGGFGATSSAAPTFGATNTVGAFGGGGGVDYRDKLTKFYQQYNPEKLNTVAVTLEKYKGNEAKLFQMLEQKYLKTGAPAVATGGFGASAAPTFGGGGSAFGAPAALGVSASGPPAFGAPSALGGTSAPAFGASSGLGGGGGAPAFGARFGATSAPGAAPAAGGGFSAFSSQPASFGGFGGQQGAASGFGGGNGGGFGTGTDGFGSAGGFGGAANQGGGFGATGGGFGMR